MMKTSYALFSVSILLFSMCAPFRGGEVREAAPGAFSADVSPGEGRADVRGERKQPDVNSDSKQNGGKPEGERPAAEISGAAVSPPSPPFRPSVPGARVSRVSVPGKYVALTFDDGPSASLTPRVLDILRRNEARGTFFVLGKNAVRNQSVLARATAEGNEIAVHTWDHPQLTSCGTQAIRSQIERTMSVVEQATGRKPALMRPPYGATNGGIVNMLFRDYGLTSVLWDVDTNDWRHPGVSVVVDRAVGNARPGSIILVHDIHASTVDAVEGIVTGLQARGFKLVTVSELLTLARRAAQDGAEGSSSASEGGSVAALEAKPMLEEVAPQSGVSAPGSGLSPHPSGLVEEGTAVGVRPVASGESSIGSPVVNEISAKTEEAPPASSISGGSELSR